jgi:hypothetical protein
LSTLPLLISDLIVRCSFKARSSENVSLNRSKSLHEPRFIIRAVGIDRKMSTDVHQVRISTGDDRFRRPDGGRTVFPTSKIYVFKGRFDLIDTTVSFLDFRRGKNTSGVNGQYVVNAPGCSSSGVTPRRRTALCVLRAQRPSVEREPRHVIVVSETALIPPWHSSLQSAYLNMLELVLELVGLLLND